MSTEPSWHPGSLATGRPSYVALADAIAHDVARHRLAPGDRLPTHRALARALGVTVGTIARGYAEAERRGLVAGEVGRGTFVRAAFGLGASETTLVDLASLHPPIGPGVLPAERLAATLRSLADDPVALRAVVETEHSADSPAHRAVAATWVAHGSFAPPAESVLLTAGAQHALTLCLMALVPTGSAVATTALTNPGLVAAGRQLGVPLVAVENDDDGPLPESLAARCKEHRIAAVHLQPTLSNPWGRTMPADRRERLVRVAARHDLWVIEDDPLAPLVPGRPEPVAALAPDRTCHLASAAKVLALGLRVGVLTAPEAAYPRLAGALRASTWLAAPLLGELLARWVQDGTARQVVEQRIAATSERNAAARRQLAGLDVTGDPDSPHLWLALPHPWTAGAFVAAARELGVLVSPGDDYVVDRGHPAFGVRIGLNAEVSDHALRDALVTVARIVPAGPHAATPA